LFEFRQGANRPPAVIEIIGFHQGKECIDRGVTECRQVGDNTLGASVIPRG